MTWFAKRDNIRTATAIVKTHVCVAIVLAHYIARGGSKPTKTRHQDIFTGTNYYAKFLTIF